MRLARQLIALIVAGFLLLTAPSTATQQTPYLKPFTAEYSLRRGALVFARVRVTLSLVPPGSYRYRAQTSPTGLTALFRSDKITEISEGIIEELRPIPLSYHYRHDKSDNLRQVDLQFDWQALRVINRTESSRWTMRISPGTQDKFGHQLNLMLALAEGQRDIRYEVADGGLKKDYRFKFHKEESISTPAGEFHTLKMNRSKDGKPSQASLWLAPAANYLPVKVERREQDDPFLMELKSIQWSEPG
ncbi:MAG: DUF3108 domain-containing protein [Gammaproteobacteria bacterium]|nr:DUF3108 domain-containing protein [Gammaproteobacteria bacterium]